MNTAFALIDCNSFYASCERIFNQKLEHQPVIVLSNNDGCVIARTKEAKAVGIKMGQPYFEIKAMAKLHNVFVASTNFTLYGDISNRVMETIRYFLDEVEVYSIDEAFIELPPFQPSDLESYCRDIKNTIKKWTGIPVSIGIGSTKTLAKAANELAKQKEEYNGVLNLYSGQVHSNWALSQLDIADVWGIGRQYTKLFYGHGIRTAAQLKDIDDVWLKNYFNINIHKTVMELRGISCVEREDVTANKKSIVCSRTFKSPVTAPATLQSLVASYVSRAAEKLRSQDSEAKSITVFIETSRFNKDTHYANSIHIRLPESTSSTLDLITTALAGLKKIYKQNVRYKRAGVMLTDFQTTTIHQLDMFTNSVRKKKQNALMKCVDEINAKWGRGAITSAAESFNGLQFMRQHHISAKFTSQWGELPVVKA